ncbi:MAG: 6,7-dimethyl-8-ribityllumazine synthase [Rhizomicrobium sp.]
MGKDAMTPNILIVEARFYPHIADAMLDGAMAALEAGSAQFQRITVPGALEIPAAILFAARAGEGAGISYDGFVALGCIIRGDTYHFEVVSNESARGLMELGLQHGLCIGNGILTVDSEEQAVARAARDGLDKGGDAARACLALIAVRARLGAHL